jgi:hypothetical protein
MMAEVCFHLGQAFRGVIFAKTYGGGKHGQEQSLQGDSFLPHFMQHAGARRRTLRRSPRLPPPTYRSSCNADGDAISALGDPLETIKKVALP